MMDACIGREEVMQRALEAVKMLLANGEAKVAKQKRQGIIGRQTVFTSVQEMEESEPTHVDCGTD